MRKGDLPKSDNFEDRTTAWHKFIENQFYKLLEDTGVAYKDLQDLRHKGIVGPEVAPFLRPRDPANYDGPIVNSFAHYYDFDEDEEALLKKGYTPKDILMFRAQKRIPNLLGK